ncbi:MAG: hypothetical protein Q4P65_02420 [Eubacteriales bacterium]|nr:hypothetical protein [Eubacteriales bacterium]
MKKVIALTLMFIMLFALVACQDKGGKVETEPAAEVEGEKQEEVKQDEEQPAEEPAKQDVADMTPEQQFVEEYLQAVKASKLTGDLSALKEFYEPGVWATQELIVDYMFTESSMESSNFTIFLEFMMSKEIENLSWQYKLTENFTDGTIRLDYDISSVDLNEASKAAQEDPVMNELMEKESLTPDEGKQLKEVMAELWDPEVKDVTIIYNIDLKKTEDGKFQIVNDAYWNMINALMTPESYEIDYDAVEAGGDREFVPGLGYEEEDAE